MLDDSRVSFNSRHETIVGLLLPFCRLQQILHSFDFGFHDGPKPLFLWTMYLGLILTSS